MPAFDFPPNAANPNPPEVGDVYQPPGSGITYVWNGTVWNASVGQLTTGVTLVSGGDGIDTSPANGITGTGSVAVDSTVVRTTGAQTINDIKTFADGVYGNSFGGTSTYTSLADGSGTQLGSITAINDTKLTIATTAGAFGAQLVTPDDQYVEVVSGAAAYARFNAADSSLRLGGTLATAPNVKIKATGEVTASNSLIIGGDPNDGATNGVKLLSSGMILAGRPSGSSASAVFAGFTEGTTTPTSQIFANGIAQFGGDANSGTATGARIYVGGFQAAAATPAQGSRSLWDGYVTGTSTPTSRIFTDGSATFAGQILVGSNTGSNTQDASGCWVSPTGRMNFYHDQTENDPFIIATQSNGDGTSNSLFSIDGDGSAIFKQSVAIGSTAGTISATNLDAARAYELPNADGTIALTSDITGGAIEFVGDIDVVNDTAPTTPKGGIWVNTTAGNADASFTGLNQQYIALNQLIFLTDNNGWVAGGVTDPATYVTIATSQTISGTKGFTQSIGVGGTLPSSPNLLLSNDGAINSNGSATFDGNVINAGTALSYNDIPQNSGGQAVGATLGGGKLQLSRVGSSAGDMIVLQVYDGTDNTPHVTINNDGSSVFGPSSGYHVSLRPFDSATAGQIMVYEDASTVNFSVNGNGTTVIGDTAIELNSSGSATFTGDVDATDGTGTARLNPVGQLFVRAASGAALEVRNTSDPNDVQVQINADGSAQFSNYIIAETNGIFANSTQSIHGFFAGKVSASGVIADDWNSVVLGDGNAIFRSQVTVGNATGSAGTKGIALGSDGYVSVSQTSRADQDCFLVTDTNNATKTFYARGNGQGYFGATLIGNQNPLTGTWNVLLGNFWTLDGGTVPIPIGMQAGISGLIYYASAAVWPTGQAGIKYADGTPPDVSTFPAIIPYYCTDTASVLIGLPTEGIA